MSYLNAYPQAQHVVERVVQSERQRMRRQSLAQQAYYAQLPPALIPKPNKPNDNVAVNYGRLFVDKGVSFLFGKEIKFELDETKTTPEEEFIDLQWKRNKKPILLHGIGVNGGIYGHSFIQMQETDPINEHKQIRLINVDPMEVNVRWNPRDINDVLWYHIRGDGVDKDGKPLELRQRIEKQQDGTWTTFEEQRVKSNTSTAADAGAWEQTSEIPWPYPFAPIVHCQNLPAPNEFWGMADLEEDTVDLIKAINFVLSNLRKIIRYHGHPKTIGTGFTQQQIKIDTDELLILPNPESKIWNLEMIGNLQSSLDFFKTLKEALFTEARMPEIALGSMQGIGALSGVALEILYQPLLDKTETKRLLYGDMLEHICSCMLVIGGFRQSLDDVEVKITWPEVLPHDMLQERQMAQLDLGMQIASRNTLAAKLGFDFDVEKKKMQQEQADGFPAGMTAAAPASQPPQTNKPSSNGQRPEPNQDQQDQEQKQP